MGPISRKKSFVLILLSVFSLAALGLGDDFYKIGHIFSYNHDTIARNVPLYSPSRIEEVQGLIRDAYDHNENVRFSGTSHSTNSVISGSGIYIKSEKFNQILGVDENSADGPVVEVESGVKLGDLHQYLAEKGYSLGFAYPFYYGISIGGLLSTGSHGSSRLHTAQSSQNIVEMTIVNGLGEQVVVSPETPEMLKAARVSLGLLGFIYKIKLRIYKDFNIQFRSYTMKDKTALLQDNGQVNWGNVADTEYLYWYPQDNRGQKIEGYIVHKPADPGAQCVVLGMNEENFANHAIAKLLMWGKHNRFVNKKLEDQMYKRIQGPPPYERMENGKLVQAQGVIGPAAKMLLSKKAPPLSSAFAASDYAFSFRIEDAPQVLGHIRQFSLENNLSFPLIGIFMRFASARDASYLSYIERKGTAGDVYVMAEFYEPKYYTNKVPSSQWAELSQRMLQGLVQKNLVSFHWGKSTDKVFSYQANKKLLSENISEFNRVRESFDPKGIFVNDFAKKFILE